MSSAATSNAAPTRRLGRYTILEALAKGGMAQVFIAQKDNSPEICVLKQLLGELESHATAGKRFYREAHVASYLQHPRIARTIDAGFEDGAFCIAMEFIAGRDVESLMHLLMRQGRMLPYELSLSVALGVLEGLEYAHDARDPSGEPLDIVHRDLSPRNVMLSFEGDVKVIDFGLARGKVDDFKTAPGMILGTLRYVSPEQAVADPIDRRSDLYSIAVVLYEMLSGRPLVRDGKALEVLTDVVQRVPDLLSTRNPHLPRSLDPVLAKALAKDPAERYPDARTLRLAIEEAAGTLARTPRASIGEFVTGLFPQDRDKALSLLDLGRQRHAEQTGRGGRGQTQAGMRTMAGELEISSSDELASRTRTGFLDTSAMGDARTDDAHGSATRTGWVAPTGLSPRDLDNATRTVIDPAILDPTQGRASRVSNFDPLLTSAATRAPDLTQMIGGDDRTATVDMSTRTVMVHKGAPTELRARRSPLGAVLIALVLLAGAGVVVAAALTHEPTEVETLEAVAPPVESVTPQPAAIPAAIPAATRAPASPVASPARTAAPSPTRTAEPRRSPPERREVAASPSPTKNPNSVAALRGAIGSLRKEWDGLSEGDQYRRIEGLRTRIAEAAPTPAARTRVEYVAGDSRLDGRGSVADVGKLEEALRAIEEAGAP